MDELEQTRELLNRALGALQVLAPESRYVQSLTKEIREFLHQRYELAGESENPIWEISGGQA